MKRIDKQIALMISCCIQSRRKERKYKRMRYKYSTIEKNLSVFAYHNKKPAKK